MRWLVIVWVMLSLTACATLTATGLQSEFVGRPVSEAVAKVGPPTTKSQLGNGRMAFEWLHYGPCTYSAIATSYKPDFSVVSRLDYRKLARDSGLLGCKMRVDELRRESLPMRRFPPPWTIEALDGGFTPSARIMERPNEDDGHHRVGI